MTILAWSSGGEQERSIIRRMLGNQEWFVVSWQALVCAGSLTIDDYRGGWPQFTILVVTALHLVAVPIFARNGGPFSHGGKLIVAALLWALLFPCAMLLLVDSTSDTSRLAGVPMGNYVVSTLTVFAFYPWWRGRKTRQVRVYELLYVATAVTLPGIVVLACLTGPTTVGYKSAASIAAFNVAGYVLGRTIRRICRVAIEQQVEVQQQSYDEFFNFLHSHVKAGIAAIRAEWGNTAAMREKLEELEQAVSDRRIEFLLSGERVPLAALFSERIRTFAGTLILTETPRVGPLTVPRAVGLLISRALGDLLKNAVLHGGNVVAVRAETGRDQLTLEICDDGQGFDPAFLDDDNLSIARLRRSARDLGGDLKNLEAENGTVLRLVVPLDPQLEGSDAVHASIAR